MSFSTLAEPLRTGFGPGAAARCVCLLAAIGIAVSAIGCASRPDKAKAQQHPYNEPLTSPGTKFGGLPPAVQRTVRAQTGAAEIHDIRKLTKDGRTVYRVEFVNDYVFPALFVETDGSVLHPDWRVAVNAQEDANIGAVSGGPVSGIKVEDLPINVLNKVQDKAPTAEISFVKKSDLGARTLYEISFKSGKTPALYIFDDGTMLTGEQSRPALEPR